MNLYRFRILQVLSSTLIFIGVFIYFLKISPKTITEIQLSFWGSNLSIGWIWNYSLILLSGTMFFNVYSYINSIHKFNRKFSMIVFFLMICLSLFLTGIINVNINKSLHNIFAFYYFFSCPLGIFLIAHLNSKNLTYKEWILHIVFSLTIFFLPISLLHFFKGMAISETIHSSILLLWNIMLLRR